VKRDFLNDMHPLIAIAPVAARTDDTAIVSSIIDTRGYDGVTFVIATGTNTDADATFAVTMDEGDASDLTGSNAVAATDLVGTLALAGYTFSDDAETRKIGYKGIKRYVRLTVTPTGNAAGNIFLAAVAILGLPTQLPTANPPV
jgi:hypothetical protein